MSLALRKRKRTLAIVPDSATGKALKKTPVGELENTTDREAANTQEVHVMLLLHFPLRGGWSMHISFSSWWVVSITLHHLCINPIQLQGLVLPALYPPHAWAWLRHTCHCFRVRCAGCQVHESMINYTRVVSSCNIIYL